MSSANTSSATASSLPPPPVQYYSAFGDEARSRGSVAPKPPPPPAATDTYSMFGSTFCHTDPIVQPLESQGIRRLYSLNFDHRRELKKLNHSVLANFLDLLEILIRCPDSASRIEKLEDTKLLFIHMHHLINEFRPHQARETLRVTLELQKRKRLEVADRFQAHLEKVEETISDALHVLKQSDVLERKSNVQFELEEDRTDVALVVESEPTAPGQKSADYEDYTLDSALCRLADEIS